MRKCKIIILFYLLISSYQVMSQCAANAGQDTSICIGGSVVIGGAIPATGTAPISYSWSPTTDLSCTNCGNPTANPSANQTYTLTITDGMGCIAASSINITVFPPPPASFTFVGNNNCGNVPVQFTNTTPGAGLIYSWNFGDPTSGVNNTSSIENPAHTFNWTGTGVQNFIVTLTVTSPGGCVTTSQQSVSIMGMPGAALVDPTDDFRNCDGSNFSLTVYDATSISGNTLYTIIWGDGSPNYSTASAPTGGVNHVYLASAVFELYYIVQGVNGCMDTAKYIVSNITNPAIGAANPGGSTGCGPLTLCFPLNNYGTNHSTTVYIVNFGDGTPPDTLSHPPPSSVCHTYDSTSCGSPGNQFAFSIRAINSCDQSEATIAPIRVFIAPVPNFHADTGCVNQPITFVNLTRTGFNSSCNGSGIFKWDFGDGGTLTTANPGNVVHTYTSPGNYTVTLIASNNCAGDTAELIICVEDIPIPDFTADIFEACAPYTANLTNLSTIVNSCNTTTSWAVLFNGSPCLPSSGLYQFVNGTNSTSLNPQIQFLDGGEYTVTLTMLNSCGVFEKTMDFIAQLPPQPTLSSLPDMCAGDSVIPVSSNLDCLESIDNFNWTFSGGLPSSSTNELPGYVTFPNPGNYQVQLQLVNACGDSTVSISVNVNPTPPMLNPTVLSPLCENDTANFTSDFVAGALYNWNGPNGFFTSTQNFDIQGLTVSDAGWYSVFGTLGACPGKLDSVELIVNISPVVTAFSSAPAICYGDTVTLSVSGAITYAWSPADSLSSPTGSSVFAFPSTTTNFVVFGTDGVCTGIDTVQVIVNPLPIIIIGPDTSLCNQNIPIQFNGSPAGGVWTGQNIDPAGTFTPNGIGDFPVVYTFVDGNSCMDSAQRIVSVVDPVAAVAGVDTAACNNDANVQLSGSPSNGVWSGFNVSTSGQFVTDSVGNFMLTYSIGNGSCLTKDSLEITIKPLPMVTAGNDTVVCVDASPFQLLGLPINGVWTGNGVTNSSGTFDPGVAGAGNHTAYLFYLDPATGCVNSDSLYVLVNDLPVVNAGVDTVICNQSITVQLNGIPVGGTWFGPNVASNGQFTPSGTGTFKLYYQFTAGSSCQNLDSVLITVNDPVPSDAGADLEACLNDPNIQLTGSPNNGTWTGTNTTSQGIFSPSQAGTFLLAISNGVGNCLTSDTMQLIVHDLPVVNAGPDQDFCLNESPVNFIASPIGGTWNGQGITDATTGAFDPGIAQPGTHLIGYTFVDATTTCSNIDTLDAIVFALPVPQFTYDTLSCINELETFTNTSTNTNLSSWDFGDGFVSSVNSPNHSYTTVGFFDIRLITQSVDGCLDTIVKPIEVREPPVATFSLAPDSACAPVEVSFVNASSGIDVSYFWQFGNGNTSVSANPGNQFYQQGYRNDSLYTIHLSVSNFCGVLMDSATVRAMPKPVAVFAPVSDVTCDQFPLDIVNNSYGFPDSFEWNFGDGTTDNTMDSILTHSFAGSSVNDTSYVIQLVASNECGSDTAYHTVFIYPSIVNAFFNTNFNEGCAPLTVQFSNFSQGETFSSWDFGDGNLSSSYNTSHTFQNPGQYTVSLYANNGCDYDTTVAVITVHPDPMMNFSFAPDSVCAFTPFQFTNLSSFASSYHWSFGDGDTSVLTNPVHSFASAGFYNVTLSGYSMQFQCSTSVTKVVRVVPGPIAAFALTPQFGCAPLVVSFTNQSTNTQFVQWDFGNGNSSNTQTATQVYDSLGAFQITLIAHAQNGCRDTVKQAVNVFEKPTVDFASVVINPCVLPLQSQFTNQSIGAVTYSWSFGDGLTSSNTNPSHTYSSIGPFTVQLIGESLQGCKDTMLHEVRGYNSAVGSLVMSQDTICAYQPVLFSAVNQFTDSILWIFGDGMQSNQNPINYLYQGGGVYTVQLISYGQGGCNDTTSALANPIVVIEPIADFTYTDYLVGGVQNGSVAFTNQSQFAVNYLWNFSTGNFSTEENPIENFYTASDYEIILIAYGAHNCSDTARATLSVTPYYGLFIPNAINPENLNWDLRHFSPSGVGLADFELWIYDDWGNVIWYTNAIDTDGRPTGAWNGRHNGEVVQQDAYVWKARATFKNGASWEGQETKNGRLKKAGTVTIIH